MRLSLNWLKEYIEIPVPAGELAQRMTMLGLEIETLEQLGADIQNVIVGQILSIEPHPNADKLVVCKTDVGQGQPLQIVCGASNMRVGDRVPTALPGATLAGGIKISQRTVRGVQSWGMMCSPQELGLDPNEAGLLILDPQLPIGHDIVPLLDLDDVTIEFDVTPNRGDWASLIGVARELSAFFEIPYHIPDAPIRETSPAASKLASVTILDPDLCPRYIGRVLDDVTVVPSPHWLQQRLVAAGQRPINNVVDITNFVLIETGHPLHAFDYDELREHRIVVRPAKPGETIRTIDGELRALQPSMLVIADAEKPIAIAGVMGGAQSEVKETTRRVLLESAYFDPKSVRRTARALGMQTEASARFQRGADPEMARYAIDRAASMMQEILGATVAAGILDEYPKPVNRREVELRFERTHLLIGTRIAPEAQKRILQNLGFELRSTTHSTCTVRVPSWRHDVQREEDLIEEIARLHGYDRIEATLPKIPQADMVLAPHETKLHRLRHFLVGLGLTEFVNMSFSSPEETRRAGLDDSYLNMVTLANPLSANQGTLRTSLLPGMIATVSRNTRYGYANIGAFELGPVFHPVASQELPLEPTHLAMVLTGNASEKHWSEPAKTFNFFDIKGYAEAICDYLAVPCRFETTHLALYQPGQCGSIIAEETALGTFGQLREAILKAHDIEQPLYYLELDLDTPLRRPCPVPRFIPIDHFPAAHRDLAILVDASVPAGAISNAARQAAGTLLRKVHLFDLYAGEQVPQGKKSLALSLSFQADERTLTDAEVQDAFDSVLQNLQNKFGAVQR